MSIWASIGDLASSGVDTVEGWFGDSPAQPANFKQPDYAAMEKAAFGTGQEAEKGLNNIGMSGALNQGGEDAWLGKVLGPAMRQIMGTALRPSPRAPLGGGGHGINANGGTAAKVPDTIMKMATLDEPLSNIQSFSRLFG